MYLYESAIIEDINSLFTNSKVTAVIADSLNEGLRRTAAKNEDKITLPAVILTGGDWTIEDPNFYSLMHGSEIKRKSFGDIEDVIAKDINIIPITPSYNMHILASSSRACDMLTRELLFHYMMNPTLTVKIPYGVDNIHTFNILFNRSVNRSQNATGLIYRTLGFQIQGAYLWHNNTFNIVKEIETDVDVKYDKT